MVRVTWAIMIVSMPRSDGQPIARSKVTNIKSIDKPVMTSGITNGAEIKPLNKKGMALIWPAAPNFYSYLDIRRNYCYNYNV